MPKEQTKQMNEAGMVLIAPTETMSSVKIYDAAGETRIEVKVYSNNLSDASEEAQAFYDDLKKKYTRKEKRGLI